MIDWSSEFEIDPSVVFLNHAAFGPVTKRGRLAVESMMARWGRFVEGPDVDAESYALLETARQDFARLIEADSRQVAFVPNASHGLNSILWGMNLQEGERILVPESEFPAIPYVVQNIVKERGLNLDVLPCPNGHFELSDLESALRKNVAAIVLSWVQFFDGFRYDLESITDLCHRNGCFVLVDGTQGIGAVPMNAQNLKIDALACGAQKWLFGQPGSGFMYINKDSIRPIVPLYAGWMGVDWGYEFHDLKHWDKKKYDDGRRWEVGTYPYFALRFASTGLKMLLSCGSSAIWRRIRDLHHVLVAGIEGTRYGADSFKEENSSAIIVLRGPRIETLHQHLTEQKIITSLREGGLRVSPHFYNTETEIERLINTITGFDHQ